MIILTDVFLILAEKGGNKKKLKLKSLERSLLNFAFAFIRFILF